MKPHPGPEYDVDVNWGGGGIGPNHTHSIGYNITRPTRTEKLYAAIKAIYLMRERATNELVFEVIKDRGGNDGIKTFEEAIDFCAELLCEIKFDDGNHMFQESLKLKLQEVMKDVLLGDDCVPSAKAIKDYIERR